LSVNFLHRKYLLGLGLLLPILFVADILIGSVSIPLEVFIDTLKGHEISPTQSVIIIDSRIPKALTAVLAGAALAVAGLLMQTLFRNPLAGPYILGISSGAGLGVAILLMGAGMLGLSISGAFSLTLASILGSLSVLIILFTISLKVKDVMTLLILGVMIGSIATAIIGLIQYFTTDYQLKSFLMWTMGSLSSLSYEDIGVIASLVLLGIGTAYMASKNLNALLLGEEYASGIGIAVYASRLLIIVVSGLLAGVITAFCGPIGFIGIVVPHLARLLFQTTNHRLLLPASVLIGSALMLLSDLLAHILGGGMSLPINSITALVGIPIILWIIFNKRSISSGF
jgi:iron complex transport system permease protein